MIKRIKPKNLYDIYDFILFNQDKNEDFYITKNNNRLMIKDLSLLKKLIKNQKIFGFYNKGLEGILLIYYEKGFRPYIKILTNNRNVVWGLCRFFSWNFFDETYAKIKIENPILRNLQKIGFIEKGKRGKEILLYRPKQEKRFYRGEKDES